MKLQTSKVYCLYSHGNYIGEFKTMEGLHSYVLNIASKHLYPESFVNSQKYTILESTNLEANES